MEKEKKYENGAIVKDCYSLINNVVDHKMRVYVVYNAEEHEQTRKIVKETKHAIENAGKINIHDIIQYVAIILLLLGMIILQGA